MTLSLGQGIKPPDHAQYWWGQTTDPVHFPLLSSIPSRYEWHSAVTNDFHLSLWGLLNKIKVDFMEENESVMVIRDEWFTLGSILTHLKLAKARFRWVNIDPCVNHSSRAPMTDSLYHQDDNNSDGMRIIWWISNTRHPSTQYRHFGFPEKHQYWGFFLFGFVQFYENL